MSECLKCALEEEIRKARLSWYDVFAGRFDLRIFNQNVEMVEAHKSDDSMANYYGEYPQGYEGEMWVTLRVGDRFFRKVGAISSYGNESWDGPFLEVFGKTKKVTVFETV